MRVLQLSAVLVAFAACGKKDEAESTKKPPPAAVKVETVVAQEAPAPELMVLTGVVVADQRAEVTADTQGKVIQVMVERGQRVKQGASLIQLDVRTAALGAREAQASLATARAQRALADQECKRTQSLLDQGAITKSEYDRQMTQCQSALQQVAAAEARTQMMAKSVADGIVRAPFDGVVGQKMVSPGEWVAPGRPLLVLVDDEPLKVEISVPEVAVRDIKLDQRVDLRSVSDKNREKAYGAKITRLGAEIGRTRSLIVEATLDPGSGLVPGMFVEASIETGQRQRVVLPLSAVADRGKSHRAFVVTKNGEVQERPVQLGAKMADKVAILRGVDKGEKVISKLSEQITDGLRVTE